MNNTPHFRFNKTSTVEKDLNVQNQIPIVVDLVINNTHKLHVPTHRVKRTALEAAIYVLCDFL